MRGQANSFDNMGMGFDKNYGYSTSGGNDLASYSDSSGNDTFIVGSFNAWMQYTGVTTYATGFYNTTANNTAGGVDTASLFDSTANDALTTYANDNRVDFQQGVSGGNNWVNGYVINDFNSVFATKTNSGTDVTSISPNDLVNLQLAGSWI